ncbi:phosphodiester glycosidase family protein, partial [Actinoallomurus acaciae]
PTSSDVPPSPDPDAVTAVIGTRQTADGVAVQLKAAGWTARVEPVRMARFADAGPGLIGYRVRVGRYATEAEATAVSARLADASFKPSVVYTGQDGDPTTGPWAIHELTVDFRAFTGTVAESHDASLAGRRTTTQIAQDTGALAAVNGGFFIIGAADGVVGDSAGIVVSNGRLLHDATNGRVAAILRDGGRRLELQKLWTRIDLVSHGTAHQVAGLNRAPGLIRDCGGRPGDTPTSAPLMDVTCKNPNEMVAFTPEFGSPLPTGAGSEAVLDARGRVVSEGPRTATAVPGGGTVIEAIGTEADWLDRHATVGERLRLRTRVTGPGGRPVRFGPADSAVNGGPQLVHDGRVTIAPKADGLIHPDDPSYFYGWGIRRNPRTMIGVDRRGRLLLVEVDGRYAAHSEGLTIPEAGELMRSLGAVEAMNLDGGGSSTMVADGQLVNTPSDATGQRPVGDAVVVLPGKNTR